MKNDLRKQTIPTHTLGKLRIRRSALKKFSRRLGKQLSRLVRTWREGEPNRYPAVHFRRRFSRQNRPQTSE